MSLLVSIDNGGTLTDVCAVRDGEVFFGKTLTTPHDLSQCFVDALSVLATQLYGEADLQRLAGEVEHIRYSTTQGTNALVQRKGPRLGVVVDAQEAAKALTSGGASDALLADLVADRIAVIDFSAEDKDLEAAIVAVVNDLTAQGANRLVVSFGGDDFSEKEQRFRRFVYKRYPRHLLGAVPLVFAGHLSKAESQTQRTWAAILNSFLHPAMEHFLYNAENHLRDLKARNPLLIYRNDGGSTRVARTVALNTYSSGPRGGVEGVLAVLGHYGLDKAVSMDIGGTTTDIATFSGGAAAEDLFGKVEGVEVPFRLAAIESIGAGGSSILSVKDGAVQVGPESAGAAPGPACFARGGTDPTMTDVLLLSGYLDPKSYFGGQLELDRARAETAVKEKLAEPLGVSLEDALKAASDAYHGKIAEAMKGSVDQNTALVAFGGAGPISACAVADRLEIKRVLVPRLAAVFSAFGIGFSDIVHAHSVALPSASSEAVKQGLEGLVRKAKRAMKAEGFVFEDCNLQPALVWQEGSERKELAIGLEGLNGTAPPDGRVELVLTVTRPLAQFALKDAAAPKAGDAKPAGNREGVFGQLPLFTVAGLKPGETGAGPAILEDALFTAAVPEGWHFDVTGNGDIFLNRTAS